MSKTGYKRSDRVADQIRMEIAEILLRKTKDPRLQSVTVTGVDLTNDLRLARVYVTSGLGSEHDAQVLSGLKRATGFLRGELSRRLALRYSPELMFRIDTSGPRGDHMLALLESLQTEQSSEDEPAADVKGDSAAGADLRDET